MSTANHINTPGSGVWNKDTLGDALLHASALALLDGLKEAVKKDSPIPWRSYPSDRFVSMYVRVTRRLLQKHRQADPASWRTLELAAIDVQDPYKGRGTFNAVVNELQSIANSSGRALYIENVLNPDLFRHLKKRPGFYQLRMIGGVSDNCFAYFPK